MHRAAHCRDQSYNFKFHIPTFEEYIQIAQASEHVYSTARKNPWHAVCKHSAVHAGRERAALARGGWHPAACPASPSCPPALAYVLSRWKPCFPWVQGAPRAVGIYPGEPDQPLWWWGACALHVAALSKAAPSSLHCPHVLPRCSCLLDGSPFCRAPSARASSRDCNISAAACAAAPPAPAAAQRPSTPPSTTASSCPASTASPSPRLWWTRWWARREGVGADVRAGGRARPLRGPGGQASPPASWQLLPASGAVAA